MERPNTKHNNIAQLIHNACSDIYYRKIKSNQLDRKIARVYIHHHETLKTMNQM
jgi:hypothetical protein